MEEEIVIPVEVSDDSMLFPPSAEPLMLDIPPPPLPLDATSSSGSRPSARARGRAATDGDNDFDEDDASDAGSGNSSYTQHKRTRSNSRMAVASPQPGVANQKKSRSKQSPESESRWLHALQLREEGHESAADAIFLKLAAEGDARAQYEAGYSARDANRIDDAIRWWTLASSTIVDAAQNLGDLLLSLGRNVQARDAFRKGALLGSPMLLYRAAELEVELGNAEAAIPLLIKARELSRDSDWRLAAMLGGVYMGLKRFAEAVPPLEMAALHDLASKYNLGLALMETKGPQEAARTFLQASNAGQPDASRFLARMFQTGNGVARDEQQANAFFAKAAAVYRQLCDSDPDSIYCLARMYEKGESMPKDVKAACALLRRAVAFDPPSPHAMFVLARMIRSGAEPGRPEEALALLERAASLSLPKAHYALGLHWSDAGDTRRARSHFEQAGSYKDAAVRARQLSAKV